MGKDSVITLRISAILAALGVEGVTFGSATSGLLFLETAAFGSGADFAFFEIFSSSFSNLRHPCRIFHSPDIQNLARPSRDSAFVLDGAEGSSH
jgi:hypothetical protein